MKKKSPKKDLNGNAPATQNDLAVWGGEFTKRMNGIDSSLDGMDKRLDSLDTKINGVEKRLDAKIDASEKRIITTLGKKIDDAMDKIDKRIDAAVENRKTDILGVSGDELRNNFDKVKDHEERITELEKQKYR